MQSNREQSMTYGASLNIDIKEELKKLGYIEYEAQSLQGLPAAKCLIGSHNILINTFTIKQLIKMVQNNTLETIYSRYDDLMKLLGRNTLTSLGCCSPFLKNLAENVEVIEKMFLSNPSFKQELLLVRDSRWLLIKIAQFNRTVALNAVIHNTLNELQIRYVEEEIGQILKHTANTVTLQNVNDTYILSAFAYSIIANHYTEAGQFDAYTLLISPLPTEKANLIKRVSAETPADLMLAYSLRFNITKLIEPAKEHPLTVKEKRPRNTSKRPSSPQEENSEASAAMPHPHKKPKSVAEKLPAHLDIRKTAKNRIRFLIGKTTVFINDPNAWALKFRNTRLHENWDELYTFLRDLKETHVTGINHVTRLKTFDEQAHAKLSNFLSSKKPFLVETTVEKFKDAFSEILTNDKLAGYFMMTLFRRMALENVVFPAPNTTLGASTAGVQSRAATDNVIAPTINNNANTQAFFTFPFFDDDDNDTARADLTSNATSPQMSAASNTETTSLFGTMPDEENNVSLFRWGSDNRPINTPHSFFHMALEPLPPIFQQRSSTQEQLNHAVENTMGNQTSMNIAMTVNNNR